MIIVTNSNNKLMHQSAYVEMDAYTVYVKAKSKLDYYKKTYEDLYNHYLELFVEEITEKALFWRSNWLGRFLFGKMLSKEEILKKAKYETEWYAWGGGESLKVPGDNDLNEADWEYRIFRVELEPIIIAASSSTNGKIMISADKVKWLA